MGLRSTVALISVFGLCVVVACDRNREPQTQTSPTTTASAVTSSSAAVETTPTKPIPPTATPTLGYTPKLVPMKGQRGSVTFDVSLPQVDGSGNAAARDRFNQGMQTALDDLINEVNDRKYIGVQIWTGGVDLRPGEESSRVTGITEHLLAGVTVFGWEGAHGAHPNLDVTTLVINTATAQPITFADVFPNQEVARARLRELVPQLDSTGRLKAGGSNLGDTRQSLEHEKFEKWLPTPDGLRVYVAVYTALGHFASVTVPWAKIRDFVAPAELPILLS